MDRFDEMARALRRKVYKVFMGRIPTMEIDGEMEELIAYAFRQVDESARKDERERCEDAITSTLKGSRPDNMRLPLWAVDIAMDAIRTLSDPQPEAPPSAQKGETR